MPTPTERLPSDARPRRHTAALWLTLILLIVWSIPYRGLALYADDRAGAACSACRRCVRRWRRSGAANPLVGYLALSAWLLIQIPTVAMHPKKPWKNCAASG